MNLNLTEVEPLVETFLCTLLVMMMLMKSISKISRNQRLRNSDPIVLLLLVLISLTMIKTGKFFKSRLHIMNENKVGLWTGFLATKILTLTMPMLMQSHRTAPILQTKAGV